MTASFYFIHVKLLKTEAIQNLPSKTKSWVKQGRTGRSGWAVCASFLGVLGDMNWSLHLSVCAPQTDRQADTVFSTLGKGQAPAASS